MNSAKTLFALAERGQMSSQQLKAAEFPSQCALKSNIPWPRIPQLQLGLIPPSPLFSRGREAWSWVGRASHDAAPSSCLRVWSPSHRLDVAAGQVKVI